MPFNACEVKEKGQHQLMANSVPLCAVAVAQYLSDHDLVQVRAVHVRSIQKRDPALHRVVDHLRHILLRLGSSVGRAHAHAPQPLGRNLEPLRPQLHPRHLHHLLHRRHRFQFSPQTHSTTASSAAPTRTAEFDAISAQQELRLLSLRSDCFDGTAAGGLALYAGNLTLYRDPCVVWPQSIIPSWNWGLSLINDVNLPLPWILLNSPHHRLW
jgi:hypothetical protein